MQVRVILATLSNLDDKVVSYQENIPTATAEKVKAGMLEGVEAALGIAKGSLPTPFYTRLQLW